VIRADESCRLLVNFGVLRIWLGVIVCGVASFTWNLRRLRGVHCGFLWGSPLVGGVLCGFRWGLRMRRVRGVLWECAALRGVV
jgi:hypothetical protein